MQVSVVSTTQLAVQKTREWLQSYATQPIIVLASGGSSAPILATAWQGLTAEHQANITFSLADERYGEPGHENSNWSLLQRCGIDLQDARHQPVLHTNAPMPEVTAHWGAWLHSKLYGPTPVIAFLGIGDDSHIAGLKPHSPALHDLQVAACYDWSDFQRITITPTGLLRATSTVVYAHGAGKKDTIALLGTEQDFDTYPSQLLKQLPDCTVYYQQQITGGSG